MDGPVLLLTNHVDVPNGTILCAIRGVWKGKIRENDVFVINQASLPGELPLGSASQNSVLFILKKPEPSTWQLLGEISRILKVNGTLLIQISSQKPDMPSCILEKELLMAGFIGVEVLDMEHIFFSEGTSTTTLTIKAKKAPWAIGSSFSIRKAINLLPMIQIENDSDLIDEDSLLTEEDLKRPQLPIGDCEVGRTRKACKNCTCGRAEAEKLLKPGLTLGQLENPQSACGNCGLGDAFRCGTCPYRGLPTFKPGEKISLPNTLLVADI